MRNMNNLQNKVKQSETRIIKRSQITPASYNPRTISNEARKGLKRNLKANGVLGGMVWNEQTTNLVSGHQKMSIMDEINKYNPDTKENDYDIKVEVIDVDLKTEKELNIFFNSPTVQGEWNNDALAQLIPEIDITNAGLDESDISILMADVPVFDIATFNQAVKKDFDDLERFTKEDAEERKRAIKEAKQQTKDKLRDEVEKEPILTLIFQSYENKVTFMELMEKDTELKMIKGEWVTERLFE